MSIELGQEGTATWVVFWETACHAMWNWRNKMVQDETFVLPIKPWMDNSTLVMENIR